MRSPEVIVTLVRPELPDGGEGIEVEYRLVLDDDDGLYHIVQRLDGVGDWGEGPRAHILEAVRIAMADCVAHEMNGFNSRLKTVTPKTFEEAILMALARDGVLPPGSPFDHSANPNYGRF